MKNHKLKFIYTITLTSLYLIAFPQNWRVGGNTTAQLAGGPPDIGTLGNDPLNIKTTQTQPINFFTSNAQRMIIEPNWGFVGIGTNTPTFPLVVRGNTLLPANSQIWGRGITLENRAALYWDGATNTGRHYFMAHSSVSPAGNFYQGYSTGYGPTAPVDYVSTVYVTTNPSAGPDGSSTFFKWLFVAEQGFERRFGVNTINPASTAEIRNVNTNNWQLRLTNQNNSFTDFQTLGTGNLSIQPQNSNTGFNLGLVNPTATIDVNGNARIRNVQPAPAPQSIIIGQQVGGVNDRELMRLDFTGNPNQILLGNGTWGTAPVSNTGVGNYCGATLNPLTNNYEVPLAGFDYYFSGQNTPNDNRVAIGVPCTAGLLPAKLSVLERSVAPVTGTTATFAGLFSNRDLPPTNSPFTAIGVYGLSNQTQISANQSNIGGVFRAENSRNNIGVLGQSSSTLAGVPKFGVYGIAAGGGTNYGVYGTSSPITTASATNTSWAVYCNGAAYYTTAYSPSDGFIKKDITPINNAIDIIRHLNPIKFNFDVNLGAAKGMNLPNSVQYGFKAQDVEQILPELVTGVQNPAVFDTLGNEVISAYDFKALNYNAFIGILAAGIQEQQLQLASKDSAINSLNDRLTALENCINTLNLCGNNHSQINNNINNSTITNVDLKDGQSIVLEQNVPNPFAEQTTINYFLPDDVKKAQLLFYNAQGKLIQTLDLTQKGKGSINVFAQDLSTGVYTYTLVADGQIVETKKMIKN